MAGDWLKMRLDLADDPAVVGIAQATKLDEFSVVGRLHKLWSWADRQSSDGYADCVTKEWLDRYIDCPGFTEALIYVGWLESMPRGVKFLNFDRHNGESAKKRALAKDRVKRFRNADGVTKALPEKRREENKTKGAQGAGKSKPNGQWWATQDATLEKAKALGISTRGESWDSLKAQIRDRLAAPA